jgi:ubiquinone/menaquinone biosynthesis C-methylase UbiE
LNVILQSKPEIKNSSLLEMIVSNAPYDKGFWINGKKLPYYTYSQPNSEAHWSDQMAGFISETTEDHFIDRHNRRIALEAIRVSLSREGASYADIGCSSGYMLQEVFTAFPHAQIMGSDYFASGLRRCHERLPQIPLFQFDVARCPWPSDLLDAVTCLNVLEHIPDDQAALRELHRILKKGGALALTVPMASHLYDMTDEVHYHVRRYGFNDLKHKILDAGFTLERLNYFGVFIYPAFYMRKKMNRAFYGKRPFQRKMELVKGQARQSGRMRWMEKICALEFAIGSHIEFPFGIRAYAVARK